MSFINTNKNVFLYAACEEALFEANVFNYNRITTFYSDLSIAEYYGLDSVKETYDRVVQSWVNDVKYFTEFVMSLNLKSWEMYTRYNNETDPTYKENYRKLSELYSELYYKGYDKFYEVHGNDEKATEYFFNIID